MTAVGDTLNMTGAVRVLDKTQLMTMNWAKGGVPFNASVPMNGSNTVWTAGYYNTSVPFVETTDGTRPAMSYIGNNEAECYASGDAIRLLGNSVFSTTVEGLVIQPRLLTAPEAAIVAKDAALAPLVKWMSGALSSAPYSFAPPYIAGARVKIPAGVGIWPAVWLLSTTDDWPPEIDILESMTDARGLQMTNSIHTKDVTWVAPVGTGYIGNGTATQGVTVKFDPTAGFHDYYALVTANEIAIFYDAVCVKTWPTPADIRTGALYLVLDYALGGPGCWAGTLPAGTTKVPPMVVGDVGVWLVDKTQQAQADLLMAQKYLASAANNLRTR